MTGVEVMPTFGEMLPQGSDEAGTGVPTVVDHATVPLEALSPYTTSFSVATTTKDPSTSGSP